MDHGPKCPSCLRLQLERNTDWKWAQENFGGWWKCSKTELWSWLHNSINLRKNYWIVHLQWVILWYANFHWIKLFKKTKKKTNSKKKKTERRQEKEGASIKKTWKNWADELKDQLRKCLDIYIKEFNLESNDNTKLNFTQWSKTNLDFRKITLVKGGRTGIRGIKLLRKVS